MFDVNDCHACVLPAVNQALVMRVSAQARCLKRCTRGCSSGNARIADHFQADRTSGNLQTRSLDAGVGNNLSHNAHSIRIEWGDAA